jgi:hypothetical protein
MVDAFADKLATGEDIKRGQPVFALRNWLINGGPKLHNGSEQRATVEGVLNALFNHLGEQPLTLIKRGENGVKFFAAKQRGNVEKVRAHLGY